MDPLTIGLIASSIGAVGSGLATVGSNKFNAKQAQIGRDWSEDMYNKYYSPSAQVGQYKEAGLNPALMYGSAGAGSMPSGPSAAAVAPPDASGIMESAMNFARLKAEIKNINADTRQKEASASNIEALTPGQVSKLASDIARNNADISVAEAQSGLYAAQTLLTQSDAKVRDEFNSLQMRLTQKNIDLATADISRIDQETANLLREWVVSFAREAEIKANAGKLSADARLALQELDILRIDERTHKAEANIAEYQDSIKKTAQVFDYVSKGASALGSVGVALGGFGAGLASGLFKSARKIGYK